VDLGVAGAQTPATVRHWRPRRLTKTRPGLGGGRSGTTLPTNNAPAIVSKLLGGGGLGRSVQPGLGENFVVQLRSRRSDPRHGRSSTPERRLPDWSNRVVTTREIARFPSNDLVMTCTGNPPYAGREDLQLVGVARFVDTAAWPVSFRVRTARGPQPAGVMRNSDRFAAEHPSTPRRCGLLSMAAGPIAPRLVNARKVGRRP
jgi:hypothetical protein